MINNVAALARSRATLVQEQTTCGGYIIAMIATPNLSGKIALVTRVARSIDAAIAKRLAADGAAVALTFLD